MNLQFISWDDLNAIKENLDQYVSKFALPSNAGYSSGYVSTDGQGLFNRCG